jgi:L-lactate utilization protein LutC
MRSLSNQKRMKKNLFNKFIEKVIPSLTESKAELKNEEEEELEKFTPNPDDPADVIFAKVFTSKGGKFFYCDDQEDFYAKLKQLLQESGWKLPYCGNDKLKEILEPTQLKFEDDYQKADSNISTCEFLIAFNGSIMVSGEQTKNLNIEDLPEALVIVAYTSQIVKNISEGLRGIQNKYGKSRPSLVTTIRTKESITTMSDSDRAKDLYIFLIEDYKEHR